MEKSAGNFIIYKFKYVSDFRRSPLIESYSLKVGSSLSLVMKFFVAAAYGFHVDVLHSRRDLQTEL